MDTKSTSKFNEAYQLTAAKAGEATRTVGAAADKAKAISTEEATSTGEIKLTGLPYYTSPHRAAGAYDNYPIPIDASIYVNAGLQSLLRQKYEMSREGDAKIVSKIASITAESDSLAIGNLKSVSGFVNGHEDHMITRDEGGRPIALSRNLIALSPWAKSQRFATVPLLDYRNAISDNDTDKISLYNYVMLKEAVNKVLVRPKVEGIENGRQLIFVSGMDVANSANYVQIMDELFSIGDDESCEAIWTNNPDDRLLDGQIELSGTATDPGYTRQIQYSGGNDHDSGVCWFGILRVYVRGFEYVFVNVPNISTPLGYSTFLTGTPNFLDQDQNYVEDFSLPLNIGNYTRFGNLLSGLQKFDEYSVVIDKAVSSQNISIVGDITPFNLALQVEVVCYHQKNVPELVNRIYSTSYSSLPVAIKKVFGVISIYVDFANIYRCVSIFNRVDLPFMLQKEAEKKSKIASNGTGCCDNCNEGLTSLPCAEYSANAKMSKAVNEKLLSMYDGYDSSCSLLKIFVLSKSSDIKPSFVSFLRSEYLKIANRNLFDIAKKGFHTRTGVGKHMLDIWYPHTSNDKVYIIRDDQTILHDEESAGLNGAVSFYTKQSPDSDEFRVNAVYLAKGPEYVTEKYYSEFLTVIGKACYALQIHKIIG